MRRAASGARKLRLWWSIAGPTRVLRPEAERLITEEQVQALFGCWTSACRKAVKSVVEKHNHLLFYALRYEGMEQIIAEHPLWRCGAQSAGHAGSALGAE